MYFSIVIPIYNAEQYLVECIESVLKQTFFDYELILVDDGSTDKSSKICDEYAIKDKRIKVIHKKNGGQSTARNLGVEYAKGKYIIFLDSDDFVNCTSFMEELHKTSIDSTDIIAFRYLKYYPERSSNCGIKMDGLDGKDKTELIKELVRRDAFFCSCWSKSVKTEVLKNNNIKFDESLSCEDMDWYFNVILNSLTMKVIDKPFICYRQREGSVTSGVYKEKNLLDYIITIQRWKDRFEQYSDYNEKVIMMSALAKLYCNLLISFSRNYGKAKSHATEVYSFIDLLEWDLNPRTKWFHKVSCVLGVNGMCRSIHLFEILREALKRLTNK